MKFDPSGVRMAL